MTDRRFLTVSHTVSNGLPRYLSNGQRIHIPRWAQISMTFTSALLARMNKSVTAYAKGNKIFLGIVSKLTPRVDVMHLQLAQTPAVLAAPSVPLQHLLAKFVVGLWIKPQPRSPGEHGLHVGLSRLARNSCL